MMGLIGGLKKALLKIARRAIEEVMQKVTSQVSIVEDQIINVIKAEVNQLVGEGKGFWGPAAERHAAEVTGKLLPELARISNSISMINTNTRQATDIMQTADQTAKSRIEDLASRFRSIYSR